ncbi:unnamed protein product [Phyllotreta striolata]|uniref:Phosphoserine aminotransferase n=1 Tax=Phyllotreta striolata TaxID=444603 RepID=A0A9N9TFU9_PHYSR|nr:unnamed protein product [Phyllotreta striolata]
MENTIMNFGAGPSKLPREVILGIKDELLSFRGTGMSITEINHRGPDYIEMNNQARDLLRKLLNVPPTHVILFIQGGGQGQFASVPLNLMGRTGTADYLVTGIWSRMASREAMNHGEVNLVIDSDDEKSIPDQKTWKLNPNASYVYYCDNDTIQGVEFPFVPETNDVPLVADMSSSFLTKRVDVSKFGVIFAAAQKNVGTAGVTIVIVREDLLGDAREHCPNVFNYELVNQMDCMYNTPPVFAVYVFYKMLQWIEKQGGVDAMEAQCAEKSKLVYEVLDQSPDFYFIHAERNVRSRINICMHIGSPTGVLELEEKFLKEVEEKKMLQLKGHRFTGGIRISLFNSITMDEVRELLAFIKEFAKKYKPVAKL